MKHRLTLPAASEERRETARALWRPFLLMALPFMLAGGLAIAVGVHILRQSNDPGGWAFVGVGGVFASIGAFGAGILLVGRYKLARGDFDCPDGQEGPTQPWQLRADWARGEVRGETRSEFICAVVAAVFGSVIAGIALVAFRGGSNDWMSWVSWLFPFGACYLAVRAAVLGWRWRKFGDSVLHLWSVPVRPGGTLQGIIHVPRCLNVHRGLTLRLVCLKRTEIGSGKRRHTRVEYLHQSEQVVAAGTLESGPHGLKVPVLFPVAQGAPTTSKIGRIEILWRLKARASMPGLDYAADFVLPVFEPG